MSSWESNQETEWLTHPDNLPVSKSAEELEEEEELRQEWIYENYIAWTWGK
ncbi:MAG: hypothetical protein K6E29_09315 [Cyanobacteria bacterium RUI128]|nr:hypothetical protein [Cyanobacteria bacterium RUI128]